MRRSTLDAELDFVLWKLNNESLLFEPTVRHLIPSSCSSMCLDVKSFRKS